MNSYSNDIRNISVGENINDIKDRGYTGFQCYDSNSKIKSWYLYKSCQINKNNYYLIKFEYDERFALNENFEALGFLIDQLAKDMLRNQELFDVVDALGGHYPGEVWRVGRGAEGIFGELVGAGRREKRGGW